MVISCTYQQYLQPFLQPRLSYRHTCQKTTKTKNTEHRHHESLTCHSQNFTQTQPITISIILHNHHNMMNKLAAALSRLCSDKAKDRTLLQQYRSHPKILCQVQFLHHCYEFDNEQPVIYSSCKYKCYSSLELVPYVACRLLSVFSCLMIFDIFSA